MRKPPENRWVRLLVLYTVASLIESMFWSQINAFTPLYLPRLGVAQRDVAAWTGAIVAVSSAIGIPLLPLWGALADRFSRQPIIVRSFVAHLLAGITCVLAGNVWVFLIGRAVMAFSLGNSGLMMTTISERAPRHRGALAFSIFNGAGPIGAFLGPLAGGPIVDRLGFPALLGIDATLMLVVILALTFGYRDEYRGRSTESILAMAIGSLGIITRSGRLRTLFPALFLLFAGWMLAFVYVPLVVTSLYTGSDPGTAVGVVVGAGGLATVVLSPVVGLLADRYGQWRILYAGGITATILWPLPALAHELVPFAISFALLNGVVSSVFALSFSVLAASAPERVRARVMSFAYLPVNVGFAVGPALGSVITSVSLSAVFPAAAVLTLVGLVALVISERQPVTDTPATA